jgi:hypothetical protein
MAYISVPEVGVIRNALKVRFGEKLKFSVRRKTHRSVFVSILSGDIDFGPLGQNSIEKIHTPVYDYGKHNALFRDIVDIINFPTADTEEYFVVPGFNEIPYFYHLEVGKKGNLYKFAGVKK